MLTMVTTPIVNHHCLHIKNYCYSSSTPLLITRYIVRGGILDVCVSVRRHGIDLLRINRVIVFMEMD